MELPRRLPFLTENGARVLPEDARESIRFITERGTGSIQAYWARQLAHVKAMAKTLLPDLQKLWEWVEPGRSGTRARIHAHLLEELMQRDATGGAAWCDRFVSGPPSLGELGEPGVYPPGPAPTGMLPREDLFRLASARFVSAKGGQDPSADEPRHEVADHTVTQLKVSCGLAGS